MRIGIFGGSFNPVHRGHIRALECFIRTAKLDKALVIPTFVPPHKDIPQLWASFEDRVAMLEIALRDIDCVEISDIEKRLYEENGEKSYTKITLSHLKSQYDGEYYLYTGTDMFVTLEGWREAEYLFKNAVITVMSRDGDSDIIEEYKKKYEEKYSARVLVVDSEHLAASSTEVRDSIVNRESTTLTVDSVAQYIKENRLYTPRMTYEEIIELAKSTLPEKRFLHTLAVEKETRYLSNLLCPEFEKELVHAALLHDITKYLTVEEHIKTACDTLDENDMKSPETLHAKSGAVLVRNMGESLWRTVKYHTTGKPDMSLFEMIIFLADYVEETRIHSSCIKERERLHSELCAVERKERLPVLRHSVERVLDGTVKYLTNKQVFIHPLTLEALDHYRTLNTEE